MFPHDCEKREHSEMKIQDCSCIVVIVENCPHAADFLAGCEEVQNGNLVLKYNLNSIEFPTYNCLRMICEG